MKYIEKNMLDDWNEDTIRENVLMIIILKNYSLKIFSEKTFESDYFLSYRNLNDVSVWFFICHFTRW